MKPYRSRKLLDMARGQSCVLCGRSDGTVVAAHSDGLGRGKGMGTKSDDFASAHLCHKCHAELGQGKSLDREAKREIMDRAIVLTHNRLVRQGKIKAELVKTVGEIEVQYQSGEVKLL